jgi:predicted transposase/invertase (TIGR01784 family)
MKPGIDPKVDYVFKWLFGKEVHEALLVDLLNAVLKLPQGRVIKSVRILNPLNDKDALDDKLSILDIKAQDQLGRQYNIEMQIRGSPGLLPRLLYYWAVLHADQLEEAEDYVELCSTITICFVNTVLFPQVADHHLCFELRSDRHPNLLFSDQQAIHLVELPKFKKKATELVDPLDLWCYFLIHGKKLDTDALPEPMRQGILRKAMEELTMFAQSDIERQRYRDRVKAERDQRSLHRELREAEEKLKAQEEKFKVQEEKLKAQEKALIAQEEALKAGERGEIIGCIHLCQLLLKRSVTPREELAVLSLEELQTMADKLQKRLTKR